MRRLLLALALTLPGCGTTLQLATSDRAQIFGGARLDATLVKHSFAGVGHEGWKRGAKALGFGSLFALDLPLSLLADVALLPYSIPSELLRDPESPDRGPQIGPWPP